MFKTTQLTKVFLVALLPLTVIWAVEQKSMNKGEIKQLIHTAASPADHQRLAAHYREEAKELDAQAQEHREMNEEYSSNPQNHAVPKYPTLAQHCKDLAGNLTQAAKNATALAEMHDQMAKQSAHSH